MEQVFPNLPPEIISNILSRLPVKALCRFKCVSKPWLALIADPQFIKSHIQQSTHGNHTNRIIILGSQTSHSIYSVDYQSPDRSSVELEMHFKYSVLCMGSFNGIILIRLGVQLCLWNPSIGMSHTFSDPFSDPSCSKIYGLGYDFVTDDFKVVGAVWSRNGPSSVHVFASKLGSWKRIGDFGYRIYHGSWTGTVLNGMPHWVVCRNTDRNSLLSTLIVCFDASEEKFMEVPRPNYGVDDDHFDLGVLGGWLCMVDRRESRSNVWVMKEYGMKESWTKLFAIPNVLGEFYIHYLKLLCFTKDGDVVIALNSRKLVVYNPKRNSYKRIRIPKDCNQFDSAFYMESLASPRGCNGTRAPLIRSK